MPEPSKIEYLESAYAVYSYIYTYAKDHNEVSLFEDEKTPFAVSYLLEQFTYSLSRILDDDFRNDNPEMDDLKWLILAGVAESGEEFLLEDVTDVIYQHFNLIENFKIFEKAYKREIEKLASKNHLNRTPENKNNSHRKKSKIKSISKHHPPVFWPEEKESKKYTPKSKSRNKKRKRIEEDENLPWDTTYKYPIHSRHSLWTVRKK